MHISRAIPSNTTIDDTVSNSNSDIVAYDPPELWSTPDACPRVPCSGFPDKKMTFSNTWHASVFSSRPEDSNKALNQTQFATVRFNGSAVYVYGVLPPTIGIPAANVEFLIDGVPVDQFSQSNVSASDFVYDFLFYSNSSLPPGAHEIKIINGKPNGPDSMFILDRIVYTNSTTAATTAINSSSSSQSPTTLSLGAILGIAAGGLIVLLLLLFCLCCTKKLFCCCARKKQKEVDIQVRV